MGRIGSESLKSGGKKKPAQVKGSGLTATPKFTQRSILKKGGAKKK